MDLVQAGVQNSELELLRGDFILNLVCFQNWLFDLRLQYIHGRRSHGGGRK